MEELEQKEKRVPCPYFNWENYRQSGIREQCQYLDLGVVAESPCLTYRCPLVEDDEEINVTGAVW